MSTLSFLDELKWRGLVHQHTPEVEDLFANHKSITAYIGFDPTADSLHIGSLVSILMLMRLQKAGHRPLVLVGGATGRIGDPSGKTDERKLLAEKDLQHNIASLKKQLSRFLEFDATKIANVAEMLDNFTWTKNVSFLDFIRDTGKHITVNYMLAKESVKKRIESTQGISFTEFSYQLLQAFDFLYLYEHKNCVLQIGGADQWGNIVTGTELIRKKIGASAHALTTPLITKADGGKFGKSEQGNIWLDAQKTSPFAFYQFWLNASDEDAQRWIKIFTFRMPEEIDALCAEHREQAQKRLLQKTLAEDITRIVHGEAELQKAIQATDALFRDSDISYFKTLSLDALCAIVQGMSCVKTKMKENETLPSLLAETGLCSSRGEARKLVQGGGVFVNKVRITEPTHTISVSDFLHDQYLFLQVGKKHFYVLEYER